MKNISISILLALFCSSMSAQRIIEKNLNYNGQEIDIAVPFASKVDFKTWDKSTIYFKADITTKDGKFLDVYKLKVSESKRSISIESDPDDVFKSFRKEQTKNKSNRYSYTNEEYKFLYTVYVPQGAEIKISSINGHLKSETVECDLTADLINGNIEIGEYDGNLNLSTINGEIDLKMTNVNMRAETIHGDIYADKNLELISTEKHVGQTIEGRIGNASNQLIMNTINGNMYLRS